MEIVATLRPSDASAYQATLWLDQRIATRFLVQDIRPEPASTALASQGYLYTFSLVQPGQPMTIVLDVEPENPGVISGRVGVSPDDTVRLFQVVFP